MTADDETRVMEVPPESRRFMRESPPPAEAETPCVGVASVGDTHFGETQAVILRESTFHSDGRRKLEDAAQQSTKVARGRRRSSMTLPRPIALALGALVGVGMALFLVSGRGSGKMGAGDTTSLRTEVTVAVRTSEGKGLGDVPVRVENQVAMTEHSGEARFSEVELGEELNVEARCPDGYSGRDLIREIPSAVANGNDSWEFVLICQPDFVDVVLLVETGSCGEMNIWVDGVDSGKTQHGKLRLTRRLQQDEVVEVRATGTGRCEVDEVRHVALSTQKPEAHVFFEAAPVRPIWRRAKKKDTVAPSRPYRL